MERESETGGGRARSRPRERERKRERERERVKCASVRVHLSVRDHPPVHTETLVKQCERERTQTIENTFYYTSRPL